jgi:hypothetical protein
MLSRGQPEILQLATLAIWLGAAAFFSIAVAPALFAVLPSRSLAGEVVGRLLPPVFYSGVLIGIVVIVTQLSARGAWSWRGRETAGAVMVAACAVAQLVVAPRIERVRSEIGGPVESLALDDPRRIAFGRLHGFSVAWLGIAMLAAIVAAVLAVRALRSTDPALHNL